MFSKFASGDYFSLVRIGDYGHWLEWPGEVDFGSDQIWFWSRPAAREKRLQLLRYLAGTSRRQPLP